MRGRQGSQWMLWAACLLTACGGAATDSGAPGQPWPPESLGGLEPPRGTTEDPLINPATGMPYDDGPGCYQQPTPLKRGEAVELNQGARLSPRGLARWEGSYRCALSSRYVDVPEPQLGAAEATLQMDVRMVDADGLTCLGPPGGVVMAAATVSMQLQDSDGLVLQDGLCSEVASVAAWPGHTRLWLDCAGLVLQVRANWVQVERMSGEQEIFYVFPRASRYRRA